MALPALSPQVQATQAFLSALVTRVRRTRPRVPFWKLRAHRLPTLWTLYRGLLRSAPTEPVVIWLRYRFRIRKGETSPKKTRALLEEGHRMLEMFERVAQGSTTERESAILARYARMIKARWRRQQYIEIEDRELQRLHDAAHRPWLTGNVVHGTIANAPFPQLKPQPPNISRIISWRIMARERRQSTQALYNQWMGWVKDEIRAERMLGFQGEGVWAGYEKQWLDPMRRRMEEINETFKRDYARQRQLLTDQQVAKVRAARTERIRNLTYLRQRELRGEVTRQSYQRMLQGPPGRVLEQMRTDKNGEKWKLRDRVVRGSGWGGWAGKMKRSLGMGPRKKWTEKRWMRERQERGLPP